MYRVFVSLSCGLYKPTSFLIIGYYRLISFSKKIQKLSLTVVLCHTYLSKAEVVSPVPRIYIHIHIRALYLLFLSYRAVL